MPWLHDSPRSAWAIFFSVALLVLAAVISAFAQGVQYAHTVAAFGLAVTAALVAALGVAPRTPAVTTTDVWLALLAVAFVAAVLASRVAYLSAASALWLAPGFAAYVVARRTGSRALAGALGSCAAVAAVYLLFNLYAHSGSLAGPFLYRYLMTAVVLTCTFIACVWLDGRHRRHVLMFAMAALAFTMVGLTGSRGLLVAGAVGIVAAFATMPRAERMTVVVFAAGAVAGLVAAWVFPDPTVTPFVERAGTLAAPGAAGESRFVLWASVLPLVGERPLLGHGPGLLFAVWPPHRVPTDLSAGYYAHNVFLDFAVTAGIPAAVLLAMTIRSAAYAGARDRTPAHAWLLGALAALTTHALVDFNLLVPTIWLLFGVCVGMLARSAAPVADPVATHFRFGVRVAGFAVTAALAVYAATSIVGWHAHNAGVAALVDGRGDDALRYAARAMRWWPASDNGPLLRAQVILQAALERPNAASNPAAAGAAQVALGDLDKALSINPLRPETFRTAARVHAAGARLGFAPDGLVRARRMLDSALAVDPRALETRALLADLLVADGAEREALDVLMAAFRYRLEVTPATTAYARITLALAERLGDRQAPSRIPGRYLP